MKKFLLCILLLLLQPALHFLRAQTNPNYQYTLSSNVHDQPQSSIHAGNNDFLLTLYGSRLLKLKDDGSVVWHKRYVLPFTSYFYALSPNAGGYYVAAEEQPVPSSAFDQQLLITNVDTAGAVRWSQRVDSTDVSNVMIETLPDNGALVAYTSGLPGATSMRLCRFTASGVLRWHKQYSVGTTQGIFDDICADPFDPEKWVILGRHNGGGTSIIYKVDSLGNVLRSESNTLSGNEIPRSMCYRNGGFAVCSRHTISTVSPTGVFISTKVFSVPSNTFSFFHIRPTADGGMIATGQYNNTYELTVKTDSLVNVQWAYYRNTMLANPLSALECPDGDFFVAARSDSASASFINAGLFHMNSNGLTGCNDIPVPFSYMVQGNSSSPTTLSITNCAMTTYSEPVTISTTPMYHTSICFDTGMDETDDDENVSFSPNPSDGKIMFSGTIENGSLLEVYDVTGKRCAATKITEQAADLSALDNGLYLLKIISGDKVKSGRLLIAR